MKTRHALLGLAAILLSGVAFHGSCLAKGPDPAPVSSPSVAAIERITRIATENKVYRDGAEILGRIAKTAASAKVRKAAAFAASDLYLKAGDTQAAMKVLGEFAGGETGESPNGKTAPPAEATKLGFRRIADMRAAHNNGMVGVIDGKVYVVGGYTDVGGRGTDFTTTLECYDPATHKWTTLAPCPVKRQGAASFVLNGQFYIVGGEGGYSGSFNSNAFRYDPKTNKWSSTKGFPSNVWDTDSLVVAGKAHLFGGRGGYGGTSGRHYVYDPHADTWTRQSAPPVSQMLSATVYHGGKMYIFGGQHKNSERHNQFLDIIQIYDCESGSWTQQKMPEALARPVAFVMDGAVWLTGMTRKPGESAYSPADYFYLYDLKRSAWSKIRIDVPDQLTLITPPVVVGRNVYFVDAQDPSDKTVRYGRIRKAWVLHVPQSTTKAPPSQIIRKE